MSTHPSVATALLRVTAKWWPVREVSPALPDALGSESEALSVQVETVLGTDPVFRLQWLALVNAGSSPQKIYQLPAFFDFIQATDDGAAPVELVTVRRPIDHELLAVVPMRMGRHELRFKVGKLVLWRPTVPAMQLLGSVPASAGPAISTLLLARRALELFPRCKAVMLAAVTAGPVWDGLTCGPGHGIRPTLLSDWRACHLLPVPATLDAYMQQFSAKKRYNLKRQVRQLAEHYGDISLIRVEEAGQVDAMFDAISSLLPPARLAKVQRKESMQALAGHGLLLCYVVIAGGTPVGVVTGTRSAQVLHIHNIFADDSQRSLSVGTSVMHLALENIIGMGCFEVLDFGYGTPRHDYNSSQVIETRAPVALARAGGGVRHLLRAHRLFHVLAAQGVRMVKRARSAWT